MSKNKPAFPIVNEPGHPFESGLSKRELGAFLIAQGLVAKYNMSKPEDQTIIAKMACELTDTIFNVLVLTETEIKL